MTITKVMALREDEFKSGLERLCQSLSAAIKNDQPDTDGAGGAVEPTQSAFTLQMTNTLQMTGVAAPAATHAVLRHPELGHAEITFQQQPTVVLGGLMKLPRAEVNIGLTALNETARARFLAAFDQTFQRGGG